MWRSIMARPRIRFSLFQLLLLVALAAILVRAWILCSRPWGRPIYSVTALAFTPDGKTLVASLFVYYQVFDADKGGQKTTDTVGANASRSFFLVDLPNLYPARLVEREVQPFAVGNATFGERTSLGTSLSISPDGKMLATKGVGHVSLWDVGSGRKIRDIPLSADDTLAEEYYALALGWSGGLSCFGGLSWAEDGTLAVGGVKEVYVLRPGATALEKLGQTSDLCLAVVLTREGTALACIDTCGKIRLFDAHPGLCEIRPTRRLEHSDHCCLPTSRFQRGNMV